MAQPPNGICWMVDECGVVGGGGFGCVSYTHWIGYASYFPIFCVCAIITITRKQRGGTRQQEEEERPNRTNLEEIGLGDVLGLPGEERGAQEEGIGVGEVVAHHLMHDA